MGEVMRAELCQIVFSVPEHSPERHQTRVTSPDWFSLLEIKPSGLSSSSVSFKLIMDVVSVRSFQRWMKYLQTPLQGKLTEKTLSKKSGGGFEKRLFIVNSSPTLQRTPLQWRPREQEFRIICTHQGPTGTRYPTRTRNIFQYPIRTRYIFKIIGYFGFRVLEKTRFLTWTHVRLFQYWPFSHHL